ncbi:MAG: hypothetical protein QM493_09160 [Sulfurovum sp.]
MLSQSGLSLEQAPPLSVVLRLFLIGSLFGVVAGLMVIFYGVEIFNPYSVGAVTLTHLFTIGVMLFFMFGALFQMLPVIAGVTLSSPSIKSNILLYPLAFGLISFLLAFNLNLSYLYIIASILLGFALVFIIFTMLKELLKLTHQTPSSTGITIALISLLLVVSMGIYMLLSISGTITPIYYEEIKIAHYSYGLFGWITLLIISISFQVIEMFYVTPPYPNIMSKYLPIALFITLLFSFLSPLYIIIVGVLLIAYSITTLIRLAQKKRPLNDATIWFWRLGLSSLIASLLSIYIYPPVAYIFYSSFVISILFAMFYKIVPFLTWFHLSSQGYFTAPMMHEIIAPKNAMKHLYLHIITILLYLSSLLYSDIIFLAGVSTSISFMIIGYHIIYAKSIYNKTQKNEKKMEY